MTSFSERLKELRLKADLSMESLSAETEISYSAIRQWEAKMSEPRASFIIKLADFFEVTTDYILGRTDLIE